MLVMLAVLELSLTGGINHSVRGIKDDQPVVAARLLQRHTNADPFVLVRFVTGHCVPAPLYQQPGCHRDRSVIAGLRLHPTGLPAFGLALGIGVGQFTTAFAAPDPAIFGNPPPPPFVPVLHAGLDLRLQIAGPFFATMRAGASYWPAPPQPTFLREVGELEAGMGIGANL